ncbi:type I polyketide synthase [Streptomyces sp. SID14515]|nr:type I polyketide synthase [Streptomyces sp. SID14515]
MTAPNGPSQQRVIRQALANARLSSSDVDAVEGHGTGTTLGDPIEAQALLATYGQGREEPLWLGSLKSNLGHTQAAAGVAGVIKMVMAMRHGVLPRTLHVDEPSSHVDWSAGAVELLTEERAWPEVGRPRRAGVSSFGISGTNAHVILEQAPELTDPVPVTPEPACSAGLLPVVLSARTDAALRAQAQQILELGSADPVALAWSLASTRSALEHRAVVLAEDRDALAESLGALAAGTPSGRVVRGEARAGRLGFVFTGQGAQWVGMGLGLYRRFEVFASVVDEVEVLSGVPLVEVLGDGGLLGLTEWTQVAMFAVEVGLFRLLESFGVRPAGVAGHSVGEFAAAHVAGVLSLADAVALVVARGRLMQGLPAGGAMVAIAASEEEVAPFLGEGVSLAAVNGPGSVVVSGVEDAVLEVAGRFERTSRLRVSHAFHSVLMEPMLDEFARVVEGVEFSEPDSGIALVCAGDPVSAAYWVEHVRAPVRFSDAVAGLADSGVSVFVEVGPDAVLTPMVEGVLEAGPWGGVVVPTLRREQDEVGAVVRALAGLHVVGVEVDWSSVLSPRPFLDLPTYPFQHQHYWIDNTAATADVTSIGLHSAEHPMLGAVTALAYSDGYLFSGRLSLASHRWLADHVVQGAVLLPGTGFIELALHACHQVGCGSVRELTISTPLIVPERGAVSVQVSVGAPNEAGDRSLAIHARPAEAAVDDSWTTHAEGVLGTSEASGRPGNLTEWPPAGAERVESSDLYPALADLGLVYGPAFQGVRQAWIRDDEVYAEVALPEPGDDAARFGLHPAVLDAALHGVVLGADTGQALVPFAWQGVTLHATGAQSVRVRLQRTGPDTVSLGLADHSGAPVLDVEAVTVRPVTNSALTEASDGSLFELDWVPVPLPAAESTSWAVLGSPTMAEAMAAHSYPDLAALTDALADGAPTPETVLLDCAPLIRHGADLTHAVWQQLEVVQSWLSDPRFSDSRLVLLTHGAVAVQRSGEVTNPGQASLWGIARTAQTEEPDRIAVVDLDGHHDSLKALLAIVETDEPQLAVRGGQPYAPRLMRANAPGNRLAPPAGPAWTLDVVEKGTLDGLSPIANPAVTEPLLPGQVRVAVRAAGVNFRDVLITLGVYPGDARPGGEGAGVVLEVGPEVDTVAPGDRVLGMFEGAFGPIAVADHRTLAPIPEGWSFAEAAAIPVVYLTAYYALVDLASLHPGESLLVHAAAGGVGTAAVQLGAYLGAEVFGTASPAKHAVLREMGLADDHIASSRTLDFEPQFHAVTGGCGVDVVLNALTGEFLEASLRLMSEGARFLEMGKADLRDPDDVPGYQAFDLIEAGPERIGQMLRELLVLFDRGVLTLPEITTWDVHRAPEALRALSQAQLVGKAVLTVPSAPDPDRTVLITGGTGALGGLAAKHLVTVHGARKLVLASRSGSEAPGCAQLTAELADAGAAVRVVACDVGEKDELSKLLAEIPDLAGVIHTAGVLDDAVIGAQTGTSLTKVLHAKADAAWNLHQLTEDRDLAFFVMFSSASGVLGTPGQANYAAANAFLDALAQYRHAAGLPATSLAWGLWDQSTGMAGTLGQQDLRRIRADGVLPLSAADGLRLMDVARADGRPGFLPMRVSVSELRARYTGDTVPALLRGMVRGRRAAVGTRQEVSAESFSARLRTLPPANQLSVVLESMLADVAAVLGHATHGELDPNRAFRDMGFDSLAGVELRNRLRGATGLALPATAVFDYPTPSLLARQIVDQLVPAGAGPMDRIKAGLEQIDADIAVMVGDAREQAEIVHRLQATLWKLTGTESEKLGLSAEAQLDAANADEVLDFIDREFGELN